MFEQHIGQDQDRLAEIEARLAAATPDDMAWLIAEVKRLRSLLETEQRARWGAEQDEQHWRERAEDLERQRMDFIAESEALRHQVTQLADALRVAGLEE